MVTWSVTYTDPFFFLLISSYTLINVKPFSCLCVPVSQTVCPAPVTRARASHARTLINVNPFSCLCVHACLRQIFVQATRAKLSSNV